MTATNDQTVKVIKGLVVEGCRNTIQQIAYAAGVSTGTVHGIIHDQLHMTKISSR